MKTDIETHRVYNGSNHCHCRESRILDEYLEQYGKYKAKKIDYNLKKPRTKMAN